MTSMVFNNLNTAINNYKHKDKKTLLKGMYEGLYEGHSKPRERNVKTEELNQELFHDLTTNAKFSGNLFKFVEKQVSQQQREVNKKIEYIHTKIEDYIENGLPEYVEKWATKGRDRLNNNDIYKRFNNNDNIYNIIYNIIKNRKQVPTNNEINKIIENDIKKNIENRDKLEKNTEIMINNELFKPNKPDSVVNGDVNNEELNKGHFFKISDHKEIITFFKDFNNIKKCYYDYDNDCNKYWGSVRGLVQPGIPDTSTHISDELDTHTSSDTRVNKSPDIWDFDIKYHNISEFFNIYYNNYTFYIEKDRNPKDKFIEAYDKFISENEKPNNTDEKPNNTDEKPNTDENSFKNFNSEFKSSFNKDFLDINNNDIKIDSKNIIKYIRLFHYKKKTLFHYKKKTLIHENIKIPQMHLHYTESPIALQLLHVFHIYYLSNCKHYSSQLEGISKELSEKISRINLFDELTGKEEKIKNILNEINLFNDTVKVLPEQQGGKTKRKNKRKTRGGKTVKKQKSLTGNIIFGSWKDGSSIFKDSKGYYIIQWDSKKEQECKKHLKSWKPKKDDERLVLKSGKWTKQTTKK